MEILNVITLKSGIITTVKSFVMNFPRTVTDKPAAIKKAELFFLEEIFKHELIDIDDADRILTDGFWSDKNGNEVCLVWSELL